MQDPAVAEPPTPPTPLAPIAERGKAALARYKAALAAAGLPHPNGSTTKHSAAAPAPPPKPAEPIAPPLPDSPLDLPAIERTRAQIAAVDAAIDAALVPRQPCEHCGQVAGVSSLDLDRLARAKTSLREDLRLLLDKPLPGSRRPDSGPSRRGRVETLLE